jgi:3-oxoacyl-[acyl-carrier protein] reductase
LGGNNLEPDILVNNAAHLGLGRAGFLEQDRAFFREVLEVNIFGAFHCSQLAARAMKHRGAGSIVNISSLAGERAIRGRSAYNASKAALDGLSRAMALELAPCGIRVNTIAAGYIWTPRWEKLTPEDSQRRRLNIPSGGPTAPEEIAQAVMFLCSDAAPTLAGARLVIDGGLGVQQVPPDASV